jgi:hypothetical protein
MRIPEHLSRPRIGAALAHAELRAPLAFAALAAGVAVADLAGPAIGLACGLIALHEASGRPLSPLGGALATGLLASLASLIL